MVLAPQMIEDGDWTQHSEFVPVTLQSATGVNGLTYICPGAVEQTVLSVCFTFTASAAVATRTVFVQFQDQAGVAVADVAAAFTLVATNVTSFTFGFGVQQYGANSAAKIGAGIPPITLADGMKMNIGAINIDAGDTITKARLYVRQIPTAP